MHTNPSEYEYAIRTYGAEYEDRGDDYYGAVAYVGEYCVVTGFTPENFEQNAMYCSVLYRVDGMGLLAALNAVHPNQEELALVRLYSNDHENARWNHFGLLSEAMVRD